MKQDPFLESRLLSERSGVSVDEKEQVLKQVLAQADSAQPSRMTGVLRLAFASAAALLVGGILWTFVGIQNAESTIGADSLPNSGGMTETVDDQFTPKGQQNESFFEVRCGSDGVGTCSQGEQMAFRLDAPKGKPYFSAFAMHVQTQKVVWYFPRTATGQSVRGEGAHGGWLRDGIRVGQEHDFGEHKVYGVFSAAPVTREQIQQLFESGTEIDSSKYQQQVVVVEVKE